MKVVRPEDVHPQPTLGFGKLVRHVLGMFLARFLPRLPLRWFFRQCPRTFTLGQKIKFSVTRDPNDLIHSARLARKIAEIAEAREYFEESGALYVTSARLLHHAQSVLLILQDTTFSPSEMNLMFLEMYHGLGAIRVMPSDDVEYWQDRLTEVLAALLPFVAACPHEGIERLSAIQAISKAARVAELAPYRDDSRVTPMKLSYAYMGGPARVHATVAHLEVLGQKYNQAVRRLEELLHNEIPERDDLFYALMIGLAASRGANRLELHGQWLGRIYSTINMVRERYQSLEGRMYAMQQIPHEFYLAIQIWPLNIHAAEDLLGVAEALKSRVLLDQLNGCWVEPQAIEDENGPFLMPEASLSRDKVEESGEDEWGSHDLTYSQYLELKHKVSSFPIGRPWSEMESLNRQDVVFQKLYEETSAETLRRDRESILREGGLRGSAEPVPLSEIRNTLQNGELLIEFLIPREPANPNKECWITATNRDGTDSRGLYIDNAPNLQYIGDVLIERGSISDLVAEIRGAIRDQDDEQAKAGLKKLYNYLIRPVIDMGHKPEDYKRWIIVSHGPLHLIPVHALVDDEDRYLIERIPVTTAPSASIWFHMRHKRRTPVERSLLVGNPFVAPALGFDDLPDAAEEVRAIRSLLEPTMICAILIERKATEDRVKREMSLANIIHFAAHGELDLHEPLGGHRIVLSSASHEDGMLHAREIRKMNLSHVRLVVLNICDGAVCRYSSGDEPLGLLAAIIAGGAENILGGLWELRDDSARSFMVSFYQKLLGADPAVALQGAARQAIQDERSLLEWAGYQLIGPASTFEPMPGIVTKDHDRHSGTD